HLARNCTVKPRRRDVAYLQTQLLIAQKEEVGIQLQAKEFDLMAAAGDLNKIKEVNANCILMANLQQASTSGTQTDKAPVYDSDGSAENDSNVISAVSSMEQSGGTVEQNPATVDETRAYFESLYNNLVIEVEKVNSINRKMKESNADLTTELARYKNQEKCFEINQEKYDKLERCYQKSVYQEQCLTKKINALYLSSAKTIMTLNEEIANLNNQLSNEKSTVSFLQEENKKLKIDFKTCEDALLDKQVQLENKIKELDNILLKTDYQLADLFTKALLVDRFNYLIRLLGMRGLSPQELEPKLQAKDTTIKKLKENIKRLNKTSTTNSVKKDIDEIETINIELEHRVTKLIAENEHLKQTYKQLYDSIKPSRVHAKEHIVEQAKSLNPLDSASYSACKYVKLIQELLGYIRDTCPDIHKPSEKLVAVTPINKKKIVRSKSTDNTMNDRILHISSSTQKKNKVEDHSRIFTWVNFLASKDEAPDFIIKFLKMIQVRLNMTVRNIRTNNGTEFVNQTLHSYYKSVGIYHETSVARSPQQNGVVESSGLVTNPIPQQPCNPPPRNDWDRLFQPMFDEYFNHPTIAVSLVLVAAASRVVDLADSPVSMPIDQDAPSISIPSIQDQEHSPIISQGFKESPKTPHFHDDPWKRISHQKTENTAKK
ncbi:retrovirus-related pol polyprotein from transposon TNT 1-94, partial [Tanacetum coccineum]